MAKKQIAAYAEYSTTDIYPGPETLDEFIVRLQSINEELRTAGWEDLQIAIAADQAYEDYAELNISISGKRLETDKEVAARVKQEERRKIQNKKLAEAKAKSLKEKEAQELAELARLKAKYEK